LLFLLIDLTFSGVRSMVERDEFGFVVEFVACPEDEEGGHSDVRSDERVGLEGNKGIITLEESDDSVVINAKCAPHGWNGAL